MRPRPQTRFVGIPALTLLLGILLLGGCESSTSPIAFNPDTLRFTEISAGARHTCALNPEGQAWCWGYDGDGQLGTLRGRAPAYAPLPIGTDERFIDISSGARHTCGLNLEGALFCWGRAEWGTTGLPEPIGTETGFLQVASTFEHACALRANGEVACWGQGTLGQLGEASPGTSAALPVTMTGLPPIQKLAPGGSSTCALDESGGAWCWGLDDTGQLGAGGAPQTCVDLAPYGEGSSAPCSLTPIQVSATQPYVDLTAGVFHACGLRSDGVVECWGDDTAEQLGADAGGGDLCDWVSPNIPERPCTLTPRPIDGADVVFATIDRGSFHTCAATPDGEGYCWGADTFGQIGSIRSLPGAGPEPIAGDLIWSRLTGGQVHTCGITVGGAAFCWGDNSSGQLGSMVEHTVRPVLVAPPF